MPTVHLLRLFFLLTLFFLVNPGALCAQSNIPPDTFDQFTKDFNRFKQNLADLEKKIEETSQTVKQNTTSATARVQIDGLMQTVSGLLKSLADNGQATQLGQTALNYVQKKLAEIQRDTHFSKAQKDQLLAQWQRITKETEAAVTDLDAARRELAELLRILQTSGDFLAEMEELKQAQATIESVKSLANDLHAISVHLKELIQKRMNTPSM